VPLTLSDLVRRDGEAARFCNGLCGLELEKKGEKERRRRRRRKGGTEKEAAA